MKYPAIALVIKNSVPSIVYYPEEGMMRKMTLKEENISDIVLSLVKRLSLENITTLEDALVLARESDETSMDFSDFLDLESSELEFEISKTLSGIVDSVVNNTGKEYEDIDLTPEVKNELVRNKNADTFASVLDTLYNILITKTLIAASEIGMTSGIHLVDETHNSRLREKMSRELENLGVDLIVE